MTDWYPQKGRQTEALLCKDFEILFGGARGGTKTETGLAWLLYPVQHSNYRALVLRSSASDLEDWVDRAKTFYSRVGATVTGKPATVRFPSGAAIRTGHLDDKDSYSKYVGHEYQRLLVEELTQIKRETDYEKVRASCRSTISGLSPQVMCNTNPGGPGHVWVQSRWRIKGKPPYDTNSFIAEDGRSRCFIPSKIEDNPILMKVDPEYVKTIEGIKDPALRAAWRWGDWSVFSGQYFRTFSPAKHAVNAFELPEVWTLWGGLDYGETNPTAFGLYTYDTVKDTVIRVGEYYQAGKTASEYGREIRHYLDSYPYAKIDVGSVPIYADPSIWVKRRLDENVQKSPADYMAAYGLRLRRGNNDRVPGWRICKELFGGTKFAYFKETNPEFETYIPVQVHDKHNREDLMKSDVDHIADEFRYAMVGRHNKATKIEEVTKLFTSRQSSMSEVY